MAAVGTYSVTGAGAAHVPAVATYSITVSGAAQVAVGACSVTGARAAQEPAGATRSIIVSGAEPEVFCTSRASKARPQLRSARWNHRAIDANKKAIPKNKIPMHFTLGDDSSDQLAKSVDDSTELETSRRFDAQLNDIMAEMRDVKSELMQVMELVGILVRRERCAGARTEIAARKLDRMEKEKDEVDDAENEATLQEALTNNTKVVKLVVDKWFVDKGSGFGKAPTGEIVFIHASVVQGAEVFMVGTDAWAHVVNNHARAEEGYRARRAGDETRGDKKGTRRKRTEWRSK